MCLLMGQGANGGSAIYGFVLGQGTLLHEILATL